MASAGGKSKKQGRNKDECKVYRLSQRAERNKAIRLVRHLRKFPDDTVASERLKGLPESFQKDAKKFFKIAS